MPPRQPPQPRAGGAFAILVLIVLAGAAGFFISRYFTRGTPDAQPRAVTPRGTLSEWEDDNVKVFKQTNPSVVFITTSTEQYDLRTEDVYKIPQGAGSGIVWDDAGDIVTNFHVVRNAAAASVTLWNHKSYDADLVGVAPDYDLAVVRIRAPKSEMHRISVGSSHDLLVGQKVLAIGDPFGLSQTLTSGIVSATGRSINSVAGTPIDNVIQTDAAINPGNSGGPLLDSAGRLIGINTAIYSPSGSSAGIGFAIPVDTVNRIVPQLIAHGRVIRPKLGLILDDRASQDVMSELGVKGVLVIGVQPGSPAANAGIHPTQMVNGTLVYGDVITHVDGKPVASTGEIHKMMDDHKPGDTVKLTVWRNGKTMDVEVHLSGPSSTAD